MLDKRGGSGGGGVRGSKIRDRINPVLVFRLSWYRSGLYFCSGCVAATGGQVNC